MASEAAEESSRLEAAIEPGTKIKLRPEAVTARRPHLLAHARQGDVGIVIGAAKTPPPPGVAELYISVRFDGCGQDHHLTLEEVEAFEAPAEPVEHPDA